MISSLASKCQHFKLRGLQFYYIKWLKKGIPTLKSWHFEASEDIITKFKSQDLYIIRIKYWNASWSGFPPSIIPALQNIGILLHKQATWIKHFCPDCIMYKNTWFTNFISVSFWSQDLCKLKMGSLRECENLLNFLGLSSKVYKINYYGSLTVWNWKKKKLIKWNCKLPKL